MNRIKFPCRVALPFLAVALLTGCADSFHEDFNVSASIPNEPGSIEGAWVGTWRDAGSDHFGELKAIVAKVAENEYEVRFLASYKLLFLDTTQQFVTTFTGQHAGSTFHFQGMEDLGFLQGGVYTYNGYATDSEFFSTYEAGDRKGEYEMGRVSGEFAPVMEE